MGKKKNVWRVPGSGRPAAVWAVLLPMLFGGLTAPMSALFPIDGPDNLEDMVDHSEEFGIILFAGMVAALVLCAVIGRHVARGRTHLVPWLLSASGLPWVCGIVATELSLREALPQMEPASSQAVLATAKLLAVAGAPTFLGMALTASLLLSSGLVLAIASDRFRSIVPGVGARLLYCLMALPLFGLAAYCMEMRDPEQAFSLAPAALMVLIGLLLSARVSAHTTDRRGFSLDIAAVLALGLGYFVTAEMVRWGVSFDSYEALESAAPDSRAYVVERTLANMIPADTATRGVWAVLGLMLLVTARGAEGAHRFGGAAGKAIVMAVVFCVVAFGLSEQRRWREGSLMKAAAVPSFVQIDGFRPVVSEDRICCANVGIHHAAVGLDRVWTWSGEEVPIERLQSASGRGTLTRAFRALLEGEPPPPPRPPAPFSRARFWERREQVEGSRRAELLPAFPNLNLALDARLTPGHLAAVLDAAGRAGANSVDITTLRGAHLDARRIPGLPVAYGAFPYACSDRVFLANAIRPELFVRDEHLLRTKLDDASWVRIEFIMRPGDESSFGINLEEDFDAYDQPTFPGPVHPLYVSFGRATTPGNLALLSSRVCELHYDTVLIFGQPAALDAALRFRQQQHE